MMTMTLLQMPINSLTFHRLFDNSLTFPQGCSPEKEVGGRLKQGLDKDLQLHRILILLY